MVVSDTKRSLKGTGNDHRKNSTVQSSMLKDTQAARSEQDFLLLGEIWKAAEVRQLQSAAWDVLE